MATTPLKNRTVNQKTRILIVEDHPLLRAGLAQLIRSEPDLEVCCEAASAEEGFNVVTGGMVDFVITDLTLPGKSGLEFLKDIQSINPVVPVLVISMHDELLYAERILRAGGRGYLMKNEAGEKVLLAIRKVLSGQIYISEALTDRILAKVSGRATPFHVTGVEKFSDRELEIYQLIGKGTCTKEISQQLHLSPKTVESHRANIKQKLNLKTSEQLICHAANAAALRALEIRDSGRVTAFSNDRQPKEGRSSPAGKSSGEILKSIRGPDKSREAKTR
jgi:DNA-binding NarL/FixJ family response regulator